MKHYINALRNYFNFNGRISRKEYWSFFFIAIFLVLVAFGLDHMLGLAELKGQLGLYFINVPSKLGPASIAAAIFLYGLPSIAAKVRRLHDIGKSGWWFFIQLVPLVGEIWLFILLLTKGEDGPNQYGTVPQSSI